MGRKGVLFITSNHTVESRCAGLWLEHGELGKPRPDRRKRQWTLLASQVIHHAGDDNFEVLVQRFNILYRQPVVMGNQMRIQSAETAGSFPSLINARH